MVNYKVEREYNRSIEKLKESYNHTTSILGQTKVNVILQKKKRIFIY